MCDEAKATLTLASNNMAKHYDCLHNISPNYKMGDSAWVNLHNYLSMCPTKKLDDKWASPFKVTKIVSANTIKLALNSHLCGVHPVLPVSSLCMHKPDNVEGHQWALPPNPTTINNEEEFKVESILDSKVRYWQQWYLMKFKGWPSSANELLPVKNLEHTKQSIDTFHQEHPWVPMVGEAYQSSKCTRRHSREEVMSGYASGHTLIYHIRTETYDDMEVNLRPGPASPLPP